MVSATLLNSMRVFQLVPGRENGAKARLAAHHVFVSLGRTLQRKHLGHRTHARRGDFVTCQVAPRIPGIAYDGGYAEYMNAPAGALALIPDGLSVVEAAPLMCAGVTTQESQ